MNYLHNDKVANVISNQINKLIRRKFLHEKRLLDVRSGGSNSLMRCYYFIDENQEHIVHTTKEFREEINSYDVEVLMTHWNFIDIEDDDSSVYVYDAKVFEIGILLTDSFTASTDFLDYLWEDRDTEILKRIYAYEDKIFYSVSEIIEYVRSNRKCE